MVLAIAIASVLSGCGKGQDANDNTPTSDRVGPDLVVAMRTAFARWPTPSVTPIAVSTAAEPPARSSATSGPGGAADWDAFRAGYLAEGGDAAALDAFVRTLECEGSEWAGYYGQNSYYTRAQFSLDTWFKVTDHFQAEGYDADDPYFVGRAVAWWASLTVPREQWPVCGRNAGLP